MRNNKKKYYVYRTGNGLGGVSAKEQEGMEEEKSKKRINKIYG